MMCNVRSVTWEQEKILDSIVILTARAAFSFGFMMHDLIRFEHASDVFGHDDAMFERVAFRVRHFVTPPDVAIHVPGGMCRRAARPLCVSIARIALRQPALMGVRNRLPAMRSGGRSLRVRRSSGVALNKPERMTLVNATLAIRARRYRRGIPALAPAKPITRVRRNGDSLRVVEKVP